MASPQFTWWPWRTLALALPLVAATCAWAAASQGRKSVECITVFFLVIAAGNAYLFAMAIGDFGKSVIAIPVGAASAMLGVKLFAFPIANAIFIAATGALILIGTYRGNYGTLVGGVASVMLFVAAASFAQMRGPGPELCVLCTYPFMCGCIAASMPLEFTLKNIAIAALVGLEAGTRALLVGVFTAFGVMFLSSMLLPVFRAFVPAVTWNLIAIPALGAGLLLVNHTCVKTVFDSICRVEPSNPEAKVDVVETEPAENI